MTIMPIEKIYIFKAKTKAPMTYLQHRSQPAFTSIFALKACS